MLSLDQVIEKLKKNENVDCVFLTGSHGTRKAGSSSDIDLIVILKAKYKTIQSVFTYIDETFADIYFFDHLDLDKVRNFLDNHVEFVANGNSTLPVWLQKADIKFDKSGKTSALIERGFKDMVINVPFSEKYNFWQNANYNYVANKRYFDSKDPIYHEALEIRLLYSMSNLICCYFSLRNIPWTGEKNAVKWFKENDLAYYVLFERYNESLSLKERFERYSDIFSKTFPKGYEVWKKDFVVAQPQGSTNNESVSEDLERYWKNLVK